MKRILLLIVLAAFMTGCTAPSLRNGDLLFQANEGDFTDAIEAVTGGTFSHVGIIERINDKVFVLEASSKEGVVRTPLRQFLDDAAHTPDGKPIVEACRLRGWTPEQLDEAVRKAASFLGKRYDFAFSPGTERLYCSELVYESFRLPDGSPAFTARPMSFRDSSGNIAPFWMDYYEKMGTDIPEGLPGTNPNDMYRDPVLYPVPLKF